MLVKSAEILKKTDDTLVNFNVLDVLIQCNLWYVFNDLTNHLGFHTV